MIEQLYATTLTRSPAEHDATPASSRNDISRRQGSPKTRKVRCSARPSAERQAVRAVYIYITRRCMVHGAPTGAGCGHRDGNRQSFFPGHAFRAGDRDDPNGITDYLERGGDINIAKRMAGHSNVKTTELYDRRGDEVSFSEIERVGI